RGARLPLTAVETVTGQRGAEHPWPPAMIFETFEAGVKQVLGTILRDPELVDEARVQQAKLGQLRQAEMLEAEAELRRQQAEAEAVSQEKRALDAATVALAVDDALDRKKEQRKSS